MSGIQMKLEDRKRTFNPEKLGFKRIGGGRKQYSSKDTCDAYVLITSQKSGDKHVDVCRIIISHDVANKIIDSLGGQVAISMINTDPFTGSFMVSYGDDRQMSKHGNRDRRISLDSFSSEFMSALGGYGKHPYEMQTIEDGVAFIFSPKSNTSKVRK